MLKKRLVVHKIGRVVFRPFESLLRVVLRTQAAYAKFRSKPAQLHDV